ncbi:MAG TPA: glycosyltransferase family 87 protein [Tepidisphaeraceae bacterium]|nr:glycosyltransferase family 87 protein [Tepidisphaeraceae bacterium]
MIGALIVFGFELLYHYHHQTRPGGPHVVDFPTSYQAAQLAQQHRDIYLAGKTRDVKYMYPPLIAFLFAPFTFLSLARACQADLLMNMLCIFGSMALATKAILKRLNAETTGAFWPVVFLCSLVSWIQIRTELTMGETDALMLFLFTLAFYWVDSKPALGGAALGMAFNIKYLSIVAIPYFLLRWRWSAAVATVAAAIFFALLPAALLGWRENLRDLRVAFGGLLLWVNVPPEASHWVRIHDIADQLSISVTSALARLLKPGGFSNFAVMLVATGAGLLVVGLMWRMYRRNGLPMFAWPGRKDQLRQPHNALIALEWPGLVAAALIFSPDTTTRHLLMGILVNTLGAVLIVTDRPGVNPIPAILGLCIIFLTNVMPFGRAVPLLHHFYYRYSVPGLGLLLGYLLITWTALQYIAKPSTEQCEEPHAASHN